MRYSRFKYGSVGAAETFARALGAAFGDRHPDLARTPGLLITSSPYRYVPTAATTLARRLHAVVNAARARYGLPPPRWCRWTAAALRPGLRHAFGADRDRLMAVNALSFRRFPAGQVRGAHLLVVDDVRMTGAHQRCLMRERRIASRGQNVPLHRLLPRSGGRLLRPHPRGCA